MASPRETAAEANVYGGGEPSEDDNEHHQASVLVENSQYQEASGSFSVPTKTGDEESVSETRFDDERPRASGSTYSIHTDFDNTGDGAVLAGLMVSERKADEAGSVTMTEAPIFVRPSIEAETEASSGFAFSVPGKHHLYMLGMRKGPVATVQTPSAKASESVPIHDSTLPDAADLRNDVPHGFDHTHIELTHDDRAAEVAPQVVHPQEPAKKKRKKRKRRYETAPTEVTEEFAKLTPFNASITQQEEAADGIGHDALSIEQADEARRAGAEAFEIAAEYPSDARSATLVEQMAYVTVNTTASSSHSQLKHELQAAACGQSQAVDATSGSEEEQGMMLGIAAGTIQYQQPTPIVIYDDYAQAQTTSIPDEQVGSTARLASTRTDTGRVVKQKSRVNRRATAPAPAEHPQSDPFSSDPIGEVREVLVRAQQKNTALKSKFDADREALNTEISQLTEAKRMLQDDLDAVHQQKISLASLLDQQRSKVAAYEAKINRFKVFVDGLGNDVDALKKEAGVTRRKGEQLGQEGEDRKAEQAALFEQLSTCAERSAQLKDQALKACQEAQSDLQAAHFRSDYLEKQLSERNGLLAEERDRRSQLERQLITASSSNDDVLRALKSDNDMVLDKLFEIHATLEEAKSGKKSAEMVEKTLAAIQALNSQQSANADDLVSIKGIVESLSEGVASLADSAESTRDTEHSSIVSLQATLEAAFKDLSADLDRREQMLQQEAAHHESVFDLQDQVKACHIRSNDLQGKLEIAVRNESQLKDQNASLHTQVRMLQSNLAPEKGGHLQLSELKAEIDAKARELNSTRVELEAKSDELRTLSETNARLEEHSQSLQRNLSDTERQVTDINVLRQELQGKFEADLKRYRKELKEHSDRNVADQVMRVDNSLRTMASQRDSLEKKVQPLNDEIAAGRAKIQELQTHAADVTSHKDGALEKMKQQAQGWKHKAESVQGQLDSLQAAFEGEEAVTKEYNLFSTELAEEKEKHQRTSEERASLAKQAGELQQALESALAGEADAKAGLENHRSERDSALEVVRRQLAEVEEALERSEAGIQHLKINCESEVTGAQKKAEARVRALQERVTDAQGEVQRQKDADVRFRAEIEETWRDEEAAHKRNVAAAKEHATQAEAQRDEALTETERLRKELQSLIARHAEQQQQRAQQQRPSSKGSNTSATRLRVPSLAEGITPVANNKGNEPPKPRKKVDRNAHSIVDPRPVPAPEVLRRPESRAKSSEGAIRGPIVEESQLRDVTDNILGVNAATLNHRTAPKSTPFGTFSETSDDMLDTASLVRERQPPKVVEETHFDDKLPSLAAFHSNNSSNMPNEKLTSSVFSVPSVRGGPVRTSDSDNLNRISSQLQPLADDPHGFAVYEDDQQSHLMMSTQDAREQLQDSLRWTEAEKEKYSYHKTYPNPNSASKMVHHDQHREPARKRSRTNEPEMHKPTIRGESRESMGANSSHAAQILPHSSSPDFVHNTASARKMSTYHTPAGSGSTKRRLSRNDSGPVADPPLAPRAAPRAPKRKAPPSIQEGYEHERKKRKAAESAGNMGRQTMTESNRYALRGAAQPSIRDLPSMEDKPNGRGGSIYSIPSSQSQSSSRMRTLGGGTSRGARLPKKMSKSDEFNARFAQELNR